MPGERARGMMSRMESAPGALTILDGKRYLYFAGTGYFGLHGHPEVIRAGIAAFKKFGTHSATSRAGFGNNPVLLEVEERLKEFFQAEDAVYFGSGYLSSLVLVQALADHHDIIAVDAAAHFCVLDAVPSARKPVFSFRHRDPEDLQRLLKSKLKPRQRLLLLSDGVFPTFGRIAPIPDYLRVLEPYGGIIGLDDAHGVGVLGPHGRGTYEYFGLEDKVYPFAGTLSKAFGGHGGFVVGEKALAAAIKKTIGAYIGSTPTPTPVAAAAAKGIEILMRHPEMREKLGRNVAAAKAGLKKLGIPTDATPVPIIAWTLGTEEEMIKVQQEMMRRGIAIAYLKYAGAPAKGVLRITIFSTHKPGQIQKLMEELRRVL